MATIKFENIVLNELDTPIPDGYRGLEWDNFYALPHNAAGGGGGYEHVLNSGEDIAYTGIVGSFQSLDGDFNLDSGYFAAAWSSNLKVKVIGFDDGEKVAFERFTLDQEKIFVEFSSEFDSIDEVIIKTRDLAGEFYQLAMDDLSITFESDFLL